MPIYNFVCKQCGDKKEITCKYHEIKDYDITCCGEEMNRNYSEIKCGIIYKGSGFATTSKWGDMSRERKSE